MRLCCFHVFWWITTCLTCGQAEKDWSWTVNNKSIFFNQQEVKIKGINWFGYETNCRVVHGLWVREIDDFFRFLVDNKYNALRIPFSYEMVENLGEPVLWTCVVANQWMINMSIRDSLHMIFRKSMEHHMMIVLDFHTIGGVITTRPWTDTVSTQQILDVWKIMLNEFCGYPNLMAIDIKNEPHQVSWHTWGTYIRSFVHSIKSASGKIPFRGLFLVEGIQDHSVWGGSFENMDTLTQNFFHSEPRAIFSPHVYGVSVRGMPATRDTPVLFEKWFGFLRKEYENPIVIGEIGGFFITDDYDWHMKIQNYLMATGLRDIFYWCLNPDSTDTQGILLEDWWTPNQGKLDWHTLIQPDPTVLDFHSYSSY